MTGAAAYRETRFRKSKIQIDDPDYAFIYRDPGDDYGSYRYEFWRYIGGGRII